MIKLAIPSRGNKVDDHFGHCETYTLFTIDDNNRIESFETIPSPQGCGCKSNIAAILREKGVSIMLAGNIGEGALNVLHNHGLKVLRGCSGDIMQLVESYIVGDILDSGKGCTSHTCS